MELSLLKIMWINKYSFFGYFVEFVLFGIVSYILTKVFMNYFYCYLPEKIYSHYTSESELVKQPIPMRISIQKEKGE